MFNQAAKQLKSKLGLERINLDLVPIYSAKLLYHNLILPKPADRRLLFIVGCQRSGTSLMNRIFTRDLNVSVYRESSQLSSNDRPKKLRLNPYDDLQQKIARNHAPLIVLKPLVESQNILELLSYFPESKALWMYRHYRDVASSNLKRFGVHTGIQDLEPIVNRDLHNWRSEKVSDEVRSVILQHFSADMNPHDAAALFWYVRNRLFYELNLAHNPRVLLCRYEDLTTQPQIMMSQIYRFAGLFHTSSRITQEVHPQSVGKGNQVNLSPAIEKICQALLQQLDRTYSDQPSIG